MSIKLKIKYHQIKLKCNPKIRKIYKNVFIEHKNNLYKGKYHVWHIYEIKQETYNTKLRKGHHGEINTIHWITLHNIPYKHKKSKLKNNARRRWWHYTDKWRRIHRCN